MRIIIKDRHHVASHHDLMIEGIKKYLPETLGEIKVIEVISQNRVYKVTTDKYVMKARYVDSKNHELHRGMLEAGYDLPEIIEAVVVSRSNKHDKIWKFMRWIEEGKQKVDRTHVHKTPVRYYRQWGEILGKFANYSYDKLYITMWDTGWWNFIVDTEDRVRLIDDSKIKLRPVPEMGVLFDILFNWHYTKEQRGAFIDGYVSKVGKSRIPKAMEVLKSSGDFLRRVHEKLAE